MKTAEMYSHLGLTLTPEELSLPVVLSPEQILFRRQAKRDLGKLFAQEMAEDDDTCFLASGGAFFDNKKIHVLFKSAKLWRQQNQPYLEDNDFIAFFKPLHAHVYVAGADTAEGLRRGDYCSLKIFDATAKREVFAYRARIGIDKFAQVLDHWCRHFNNALLGVERNNHGHAVLAWLENSYRYPNLYRERTNTNVIGFDDKEPKMGWATTKNSKAKMLDMLRIALEGNSEDDEFHFDPEILILDQIFLQECLTFVEQSGKYEASEGKYDDTVMSTAIAYQMYQNISGQLNIIGTPGGISGIVTGIPRQADF